MKELLIYSHPDCLLKNNGQNHPERKERVEIIIKTIKKIIDYKITIKDSPLADLETINLVIVAEAPLNSNQYIFNKASKNTPFLYKSTLEKCIRAYKNYIPETETNKIDLMRDLGIIIIEAYPFSLSAS